MPFHPPGPSDVRGGVASYIEMLDTYDICLKIGRGTDQLLDFAEDMELVSLNAEIAAAQSSDNKEAFTVLAHEAGAIAKRMNDATQRIAHHSDEILRHTLRGVLAARSHDAMATVRLEATENPTRKRNVARLDAAVHAIGGQVVRTVELTAAAMRGIEALRREIESLNMHFQPMAAYFRIEASRDERRGHYFVTIADHLQELSVKATACLASLQHLRRYWSRELSVPIRIRRDNGRSLSATTIELTRGTATFRLPMTPARESRLAMRLALQRGEVEVQGVVRRLEPLPGGMTLVGVEFRDLSSEAHGALLAHIEQSLSA